MYITKDEVKDFQAEVFCLTGAVPMWSRTDLLAHIEARDGEWTERVTRNTTILVVGQRAGSKLDKAEEYGLRMMKASDFLQLLAVTPVIDPDANLRPLSHGSSRKYLGGAHAISPNARPAQPETPAQPALSVLGGSAVEYEPVCTSTPRYDVTDIYNAAPLADEPAPDGSAIEETKIHHTLIRRIPWRLISEGTLAILVVIFRATLVLSVCSICVVFWLMGIPVSPSR
ncbi:MAG: BRCT domain-containing protein [Bacteroidaceae bacterium]|nr:BRCT domain-containing protein [Bacteroidaceae bacterium]